MTADDLLENLRIWDERRAAHQARMHWNTPTAYGGQVQIIETTAMVQISELLTVRRTWRERLYDWPWPPWQATKEERRWEALEKAIYDGVCFFVHPCFARRLRDQLSTPYQIQQDPRTRPGHP